MVARLELPMHTIRYTFTSEDPSSPFSDDSEGPATIDVKSLDGEEATKAGAPATEEEAKEQGYEPVGYTNLPLAAGKVVGSPTTAGGPYRTSDGSSCYVRTTEGIDGSKVYDYVSFLEGIGTKSWKECSVSKAYEKAAKNSSSIGPGDLIGCVWSAKSFLEEKAKYDTFEDMVNSSNLSDEEKEELRRRIEFARNTRYASIGLSLASSYTPLEAALPLGIFSLLSGFYADVFDADIMARFFWDRLCRGSGTDASMDPSGTVVDAVTGEPVPGAKATLWYAPLPGVDPEPWDASPWGQENPIATDGGGRFSWEVPEGWWQVRVEAEGYWPAQSEWVRMPAATEPDLQIGLRPASLPQPGGAACADCSVAPGPSARLGRVA